MTSPKQPVQKTRRDWYPYYAGYTEQFVESVLEGPLAKAKCVLDPWSGSGTTTAVCTKKNIESHGLDINPALTVIARARLTPRNIKKSLSSIGKKLVEAAKSNLPELEAQDLLLNWLRPEPVLFLRAIKKQIEEFTNKAPSKGASITVVDVDTLPLMTCFYYSALFLTVRSILQPFRSSNPAWHRQPDSRRYRLFPSQDRIESLYNSHVEFLEERLQIPQELHTDNSRNIITGTASNLPYTDGLFDGVLTSPPYATRIDYVMEVLPELAVLGTDRGGIDRLRKGTTGTPVVRGRDRDAKLKFQSYGQTVLRAIKRHESHGSENYYWPWMTQYFESLRGGLSEISRVVMPGSPVCVVVQDSYYKEVHVDLQRIVIEMMGALGRNLRQRKDYVALNLIARINKRAKKHKRKRTAVESLLVFE